MIYDAKILYVEDDEALSLLTKDLLEEQKFEVVHCIDGVSALKAFKEIKFDICILDVMLPKLDGFELAKKIRQLNSEIPILFLTAKQLPEDKVKGLLIGGDDYITKPYNIDELLLRVKIFLKRKTIVRNEQGNVQVGNIVLNPRDLELFYDNELIHKLTQRECELLLLLIKNKNIVMRRSEILEKIWGKDDYFTGRSMDVFMSRLRKYLSPDNTISIENIHGVGFRLHVRNLLEKD